VVFLMEEAAIRCATPHLDSDALTGGFEVAIRHFVPATDEDECFVRADPGGVDGRKLHLDVEVRRGDTVLASGRHARRVLPRNELKGP
jgi:predicted thioesterase